MGSFVGRRLINVSSHEITGCTEKAKRDLVWFAERIENFDKIICVLKYLYSGGRGVKIELVVVARLIALGSLTHGEIYVLG